MVADDACDTGTTSQHQTTTKPWLLIGGPASVSSIGLNVEVTGTKDAEGETGADNLNQIYTATDPDVATMEPAEPTKSPPGVDAPDTTESATPLGIKSSPPPLPIPAQAQVSTPNVDNEGDVTPGSGSDSEAETVVLPGADGYSPSKIRKKRKIKLEDKSNENGGDINMDIDVDTDKDTHIAQVDVKAEEGQNWNEGAASLLGKRKRSKHGSATRRDDNHTGNSSGLSSVPTSPAARSLPGPPKRTGSEPIRSRSQSPSVPRKEKRRSEQVNNESGSERDKDNRRSHKRRNSNANNSGKRSKNSPADGTPQHHRTESPSPTRHNNTSAQHSATSGAANGLSHKKKAVPAPLRATKDHHPIDYQSDASSTGESPYPRRSRTRNLGTPPTGDSAHSLAKMPPHRRRPDRYGRTPLTDACEDGDYDKAKHLLAEYPEDLDQPDAARNTPLQCASLNGHEDIVQMLLQNGCNIHCKNDLGDSPLLDAVENGHLEVIKLLLGAGVDPRARNKLGEEPIMKINKDDDDADAIREALLAARSTYAQARPSATSQTPQAETSDSRNRRTMSHGRSNRTGQHQLYTPLNVTTLRTAAAKGDLQTVGLIAAVLEEGLDDAESLIAAAKGGHDDVLQILLAVGNANPDPSPIPGSWEYATPMLAAIGGENIKVIELLLANIDDGRFDPTKIYRGRTYYEIAKERAGPLWEEEEKLLKGAFDNYKSPGRSGRSGHSNNQPSRSHRKKPSDASDRPNGNKEKHEAGGNGDDHGARRDQKPHTTHGLGSPGRKGASRSKEGGETFDRESIPSPTQERKRSELDRTVSPSESEPAKPRRKLISGRDLKGGREKHKPSTSITSPPGATSAGADDDKLDAAGRKKNLQRSDSKATSDAATERSRSAKRDKSTDRMSTIRAQSPAKRPRTSSTPPSESQDASNKRRRLESESKGLRRSESVRGTSPNHRKPIPPRSDSSMQKPSISKEQRFDSSRKESQKLPGKPPLSGDSRQSTNDSAKSSSHKEARPRPTEGVTSARSSQEADQKSASAEEVAALAKKKAQKEAREAMEAEREKAEREKAEREKAEREKAEREKAEQEKVKREVKIKKEEDDRIEKERAEEAKRHVEEARIAREAAEKRKREEQARRAEEDARRAKEEAELQEQQRREEAEAQRRAEEERKHKLEEQQRIQREEAERRRAAHIAEQRAERLRLMKEKEAARLARLPSLLRWFDGLECPATREVAVKFKLMQGVRYDTIVPEATGEPDGREQWLLNTQVALLLGEKDLQLSRCKSRHPFHGPCRC